MNLADLNKLNTMSLTPKLRDAIWFAMTKHQGQLRKGGEPYILHCLRVMLAMDMEFGMIVAVLHDVVEDTDATIQNIYDRFGTSVGLAVGHLTRGEGETYNNYIARATCTNLTAKVKVADITDNLHNLHQLPNQKEAQSLAARYNETLWGLHHRGFKQ